MYSLNAPVPGRVRAFAADLYPELSAFENVREDHSLLVKRLGDAEAYDRLAHRARRALTDASPFEIAVTGIDYFAEPTAGTAPVVYLDVESPGLEAVHRQLVDALGAVPELEGEDYTSHVTLARDGDLETARRLADREIEPIRWTVTELQFTDAHHDTAIGTVSLR